MERTEGGNRSIGVEGSKSLWPHACQNTEASFCSLVIANFGCRDAGQ